MVQSFEQFLRDHKDEIEVLQILYCKPYAVGLSLKQVKTASALRKVDLHPTIATLLKEFVGERKSGFLFRTRNGKPLGSSNILRRHLHPALKQLGFINPFTGTNKVGNHAFRRFRNTHLRNRTGCPEGLQKFWMGHADESMGDLYDKIKEDVEFRKEWAEKCGFGFELSSVVPNVPKMEENSITAQPHNMLILIEIEWSGREDLNLRPLGPKLTMLFRINNLRIVIVVLQSHKFF
jgi:hypothetical protein